MGRPRSQVARDKALAATGELALETGLASTTIDEVSRRSGVAKTTIYRHFEHRNALLIAALDRITDAPRTPDTGSLRDDLAAFYADLIPIFANRSVQTLSLEIYAAAARDPELEDLRRGFFAGRMGPLIAILGHAVERHEITIPDDFVEVIEIVHGPLMVRSLVADDTIASLDPHVLAESATHRLTTSFTPPTRPFPS